jgi:hypothetical protein
MNDPDQDGQLDALFALARARRPDTSAAEFAFETRLLARLRARQETGSIWAMVSWRLMPFFAACVVALTLWHSQVVTETNDAEQTAYVENPGPLDSWNNLN